jgi:hypothetical protein
LRAVLDKEPLLGGAFLGSGDCFGVPGCWSMSYSRPPGPAGFPKSSTRRIHTVDLA